MNREQLQELRRLIAGQRVLALGVLVDGAPHVGLLPYAVASDYGSLLVHASGLARHARGLETGAPFAVLIHAPDTPEADPLQIERVSLQGTVERVDKGTEQYDTGRQLYVQRFPSSERTFQLGDFNVYRLRLDRGRYVAGFARAVDVTPQDILALAT